MTNTQVKKYVREEVQIQKEIQISNGDRVYKGFVREIKIATLEALFQEGKINGTQYNELVKTVDKW